jgi:formate hydrogenlyase subunit 3/multisubunit Na+/H+ antiporter MnhD subunit
LPAGPSWWGLLLLAFGAVSAVYGILQASVTSDLKRLLAYSTTENVGLMFLALGTALLLRSVGVGGPADSAVAACLLLVASHAAFKSTLFLAAGSVLHGSGERNLDRMGGLGSRMPVTALAFGVGALGAAALPVTAGFMAEWALLQSLIHGARPEDRLVAVAMPVAVAVVALTAGLALLTFVKAYGIAFLARPRSDGAAAAHESGAWTMQPAMLLSAAAVLALGLVPGLAAEAVTRAGGIGGVGRAGWAGLDLAGVGAQLDPIALSVMALLMAVPVLVVTLAAARRRPRRRVELAWGGGGVRVSPRMQYTATSYAEPLARVFDDALRPERDIEVTHTSESRYLVERVEFRQSLSDVVEERAYRPMLRLADRVGLAARGLQNGSIHRYLGYSFLALVAVLVLVAL